MTWVSIRLEAIVAVAVLIIGGISWWRKKEHSLSQINNNVFVWDDVAAFVVCPVLSTQLQFKVTPEMLYYIYPPTLGEGFYFELPTALTDEMSCKSLERKIAKKFSAFSGKSLKDIIQKKEVIVKGNFIFIRQ